ncbi:MAG: hypothetical protein ACREKR_06810, partial [Candidatus Methylomirabilales bacterium]
IAASSPSPASSQASGSPVSQHNPSSRGADPALLEDFLVLAGLSLLLLLWLRPKADEYNALVRQAPHP